MTDPRQEVYSSVDSLADWSSWAPFADAAPYAPLTPGVYQMRTPDGTIVYVGMAGPRRGQGIRGRLSIYRRGKGAVSGFGEAALDRALADADFVEAHLAAVRNGNPARVSAWAQDAIRWHNVEVRWAVCEKNEDADDLENVVVKNLLSHGIWNRVALKVGTPAAAAAPGRPLDLSIRVGTAESTVKELSRELGFDERGREIRRVLRASFPSHAKGASWDPLSPTQVAHVRATLTR